MKEGIILALCSALVACSGGHLADGWYTVADEPENVIEGDAIVTTEDFATVDLDSVTIPGIVMIEGRLKSDKVKLWAETTESRIGKRIGFVFNDSVIMAPTINCRIESGGFTIVSDDRDLIKKIYSTIKK